jgi:3'-phosphoadenosine 5'-phosphosulfate (PAPS) 3'-phosphatase
LLAYCKSYTKKWDTAAGEAVVKALGGYFTDQFGDSLVYDPKAKSYVNR